MAIRVPSTRSRPAPMSKLAKLLTMILLSAVTAVAAASPVGYSINSDGPDDLTYDSLYRLSEADYSSGERFKYVYDAAGNMTTTTSPTTASTGSTWKPARKPASGASIRRV